MKIRMAELNIELRNRYPYCERLARGYRADFDRADLSVSATEEEITAEQAAAEKPVSAGYAEAICLYRAIAEELPRFDAFVFHAAVVECDGVAYAFAAESGTGKSTHAALWQRVFGERVRILNGDKPIFRFREGVLYAYGTPWCGKEHLSLNASAPLRALCFLERAAKNRVFAITAREAVPRLFRQVMLPRDTAAADTFLSLLDRTVTSTPVYLLQCNMEPEAALVAYHGIVKE